MKKMICLGLVAALLAGIMAGCSGTSQSAPESTGYIIQSAIQAAPAEGELEKISTQGDLVLYANLSDGTVAVENTALGLTWYSNPPEGTEDAIASGFNKNALLSAITATYATEQSVSMSCGSWQSCVNRGGLSYSLEPDGSVVFLYYFVNENFYIPVRYSIADGCFQASILTQYVMENVNPNGPKNTLQSVDLLPYFGAANMEDEGYLLVPDGSGALIYYNNGRVTADTYSKQVYGTDAGSSENATPGMASGQIVKSSENQYLPVFGSSGSQRSFFAIISSGAPRATIKANSSGRYSSYNTVWTQYSYRTVGVVNQTQKDGSLLAVNINEKDLETWCDYQVSYYLLGANTTYGQMAELYRNYLIQTQGFVSRVEAGENIPLYLELYGYIEKTKSFMGIPVETKIPTTTIENANEILDSLEAAGISQVILRYNYWAKNSYFDKIQTSAKVDSVVGNAQELAALQERLEAAGGGLYLTGSLLNVYKTGNGVSTFNGVLQSVANTAQRQYALDLMSSAVDTRYDAWYLLRPTLFQKYFEKLTTSVAEAGYHGLALEDVGEMLYSELSSGGMGRSWVKEILADCIANSAQSAGLMLEGANDYAAVWASHLVETGSHNSGYDLEDDSVPFYQMVFHGYVSYSMGATNLSSNPADQTLRCIEYGAYPMFSLVGQNVDELIGSRMDSLYSGDAKLWMDYMAVQYGQVNEALQDVQDSTMVDHQILTENVRQITYSNGMMIYVNYGADSVTYMGSRIPAQGYAVFNGNGELVCSQTAASDR